MQKRGRKRPSSGKRSKLEEQYSSLLLLWGIEEFYEVRKLHYTVPESNHKYIIDFSLPNEVQIEVKGYLRDYDERHKYELIKQQHPDIDLRFVFADPNKRVPRTKMTHASWADSVGFKWCSIKDEEILKEWTKETNDKS